MSDRNPQEPVSHCATTGTDEIQFKAAFGTYRSALAVTRLNQLTTLLEKAVRRTTPFGWHSLFYRDRPFSTALKRPCGQELRARFRAGDPAAVEEYFATILSLSRYPAPIPGKHTLVFDSKRKSLHLTFSLPCPDALPSLVALSYDASLDRYREKHMSTQARDQLHRSVVCQIVLRACHELFAADIDGLITSIRFDGRIGKTPLLSVTLERGAFHSLPLTQEDAVETVELLMGTRVTAPSSSTRPGKPSTDCSMPLPVLNLADLSWQAFESLIGDIFGKEFEPLGGTVKLTKASRDGGIDAVALDPDPIRGGKIVIQAKHYTKPVSVSAVRDLYGTMMDEGAIKGILVTTATFGSASYAFAADKPLTLLNGSDFLALMAKHGHKAKIDFDARDGG